MNIRRFTCPTEGEALEEIRTELGEDAIILSYRKTEAGVVIIAMENEEMRK
jgi:flagellar biosynthesis GTPase FlhF